jgi:hypothetical protein
MYLLNYNIANENKKYETILSHILLHYSKKTSTWKRFGDFPFLAGLEALLLGPIVQFCSDDFIKGSVSMCIILKYIRDDSFFCLMLIILSMFDVEQSCSTIKGMLAFREEDFS